MLELSQIGAALAGVDHHFGLASEADDDDPPLALELEKFAAGAGPNDLSPHFKMWTEALARIRVQDCLEPGVWLGLV